VWPLGHVAGPAGSQSASTAFASQVGLVSPVTMTDGTMILVDYGTPLRYSTGITPRETPASCAVVDRTPANKGWSLLISGVALSS